MAISLVVPDSVKLRIESEYCRRTPKSAALHERAMKFLPGGDTRAVTYFAPHPLFMECGAGCCVTDVDGNEYLDLLANYTSLIHGHAHPKVTEAVSRQLLKGTTYATPLEVQIQLAQALCARVPSLELVRFCNSGTEATMSAVRAAKAFTGRSKVAKVEGGYHGFHDMAQVSVKPPLGEAGPADAPNSVPASQGLFQGVLSDIIVIAFNNIENTSRIIDRHQNDLAAVIVEPVMGSAGIIPARPEYLRCLREATRSCGALLIFDEVISFRLSYGGAQEIYGVKPDLTALGKVIGGGFPVGAFGGRADIMDLFDPRRGKVHHAGTFNGNAVTLTAGLACLELLTRAEIARINQLGDRLREGLREVLSSAGVTCQVTGMGSLTGVHFTDREVYDYRSAARSRAADALHILHLSLLNRKIFVAPRLDFYISTPMGESEISNVVQALRLALEEIKFSILAKQK